jgi:hypothetical protein
MLPQPIKYGVNLLNPVAYLRLTHDLKQAVQFLTVKYGTYCGIQIFKSLVAYPQK